MTSAPATGATDRLGMEAAPDGLSLVQDLLNSAAMDAFAVPDLLADAGVAEEWLADAQRVWARETGRTVLSLTVEERDLPSLREARDRVRAWLAGRVGNGAGEVPRATVVLEGRSGGEVGYGPAAPGAEGLVGVVLTELLLAQRDGTLNRLKACANPACGAAFYDRSRNGSRVWHDVRTCGNVANLRASRARRRAAAVDAPAGA